MQSVANFWRAAKSRMGKKTKLGFAVLVIATIPKWVGIATFWYGVAISIAPTAKKVYDLLNTTPAMLLLLAIGFALILLDQRRIASSGRKESQSAELPVPDVALIWDWTDDQKRAVTLLSLTESSKGIMVQNRHDKWMYNIQVDSIQLHQALTFDSINELGPGTHRAVVGRWNGISSIGTEYVYFFTSDENETIAASKGWKHNKPHQRGITPYFLRIPVRLTFQSGDKTWEREFDFIYDQDDETRFEKREATSAD